MSKRDLQKVYAKCLLWKSCLWISNYFAPKWIYLLVPFSPEFFEVSLYWEQMNRERPEKKAFEVLWRVVVRDHTSVSHPPRMASGVQGANGCWITTVPYRLLWFFSWAHRSFTWGPCLTLRVLGPPWNYVRICAFFSGCGKGMHSQFLRDSLGVLEPSRVKTLHYLDHC